MSSNFKFSPYWVCANTWYSMHAGEHFCLSDALCLLSPLQIQSQVPWTPSHRPPSSSPQRSQAPPPLPCLPHLPPVKPRHFPRTPLCCPHCCCRHSSPHLLCPSVPLQAPRDALDFILWSPHPQRSPHVLSTGYQAAHPQPHPASRAVSGTCHPRTRRMATTRAWEQQAGMRAQRSQAPPQRPVPTLLLHPP